MVGSPAFKADLKKELLEAGTGRERFELLGVDREAHQEARAELWEEKLRLTAKALGVALERLPVQRSAADKVRLAAALKTVTSVSNRWLSERLGMGEPASVSQYVRRFRLGGGADERAFTRAVSKVNP